MEHGHNKGCPHSIYVTIKPFLFQYYFSKDNWGEQVKSIWEEKGETRYATPKEVLFRQHQYAKGVFLLHSGKVKIYTTLPDGQCRILYLYSKGALIGYRQVISGEQYPVTAEVVEKGIVSYLSAESFLRLTQTVPSFSTSLLEALSLEFTVWVNQISIFSHYPVRIRLCICLLILWYKYTHEGRANQPISLSRSNIAEYVGASLETVVRHLKYLEDGGYIERSGRRLWVPVPINLLNVIKRGQSLVSI